ncbi:MAG: polysaccharide biosynthesis protein [Chloroflexi bacterium]|nr:polysaccharide biosynthesis protein [Chloroflexota bacterium]
MARVEHVGRWDALLPRPALVPDWGPVREAIAGRRVLVTGAGGSIGSALVGLLATLNPDRLTLVDHHEPSLFHQRQRLLAESPGLPGRFVLADVRDGRKMASVLRQNRPDIVFHLAAYKHVPLAEQNVDQVLEANVFATLGLVDLAAEFGVTHFLYPSTDKAVRPPSIYGATKRIVELALRVRAAGGRGSGAAPALRLVRLVNVFGTQGSVVDVFARQIAAGEPLTLTDPAMTRYWITLTEAVYLLAQVGCAGDLPPGIYLFDPGPAVAMGDLARRIAEMLQPGASLRLTCVGPRPGERQHEELAYPFETLVPTPYPYVVHAVEPAGWPAPPVDDWLERLRAALSRSDDDADLRRLLFALVRDGQVETTDEHR